MAIGAGEVVLTWQDNSANETSFRVERSVNGAFQEILTAGANVTTIHVTGLAAASTHLFRVRAANAAGFSGYSNTAAVITLNPPPPPAPAVPAAPSGLTAQGTSSTEILLSWRDNSNNETSFAIERQAGASFRSAVTLAVGANATSARIGGLTPGTTYTFRVRAVNAAGSSFSNIASASTAASGPALAAPTITSIKWLGGGTAQVNWLDNSSAETQYTVQRMIDGVYQAAVRVGANATSARVSGLKSGASYTFRIKVSDAAGHAAYSSPANVNTK